MSPLLELQHLKTSKIDKDTFRFWFSFKRRPIGAFVLYLSLYDTQEDTETSFRCEVKKLSKEQYESFSKTGETFGSFSIDTGILPHESYKTFKYSYLLNPLLKKRSLPQNGTLNSEIEDLTDPALLVKYLSMIQSSDFKG
ncbi:hypothetical protein [Runella zeae]|uniref:hypothetical protein n=1 Tax=Runella zeae TaxID=94255 RepID=UPI00048D401A|nr:hypothetical protein [Runella zeae]